MRIFSRTKGVCYHIPTNHTWRAFKAVDTEENGVKWFGVKIETDGHIYGVYGRRVNPPKPPNDGAKFKLLVPAGNGPDEETVKYEVAKQNAEAFQQAIMLALIDTPDDGTLDLDTINA